MPDVTFLNIARTVEVQDGETILSAALAASIDYPHGCKSGRCGRCKTRLVEGAVDLFEHSRFALPPEERAAGLILACRAVPTGNASIVWLEGDETTHPVDTLRGEVV